MTGNQKSREHHWWPVVLQKHWADKNGDVWWIEPNGKIGKKRANKRKIAYKSHGHTMLQGSLWETNFEDDFLSADDSIPRVIDALLELKPFGRTLAEFLSSIRLLFKRDRKLRDLCKFYHLDESVQRELLLLLLSLLIRSPAHRDKYERYPSIFGLPASEDVGKGNMYQNFRFAKRLCEQELISNQYFVLVHSPLKKFIFGDGTLDWVTSSLLANRICGQVLMPLTPHLCVYFCTPRIMYSTPNCASLSAAPWMVDWINNIVQVYSRDKLFFLGKPPVLTESFRQRQFFEHEKRADALIEMFDGLVETGIDRLGLLGGNFFR